CLRVLLSSVVYCDSPAHGVIFTLSLHDALPICAYVAGVSDTKSCTEGAQIYECKDGDRVLMEILDTRGIAESESLDDKVTAEEIDRKSTRLNSSHVSISYAVFCLKKKKRNTAKK